jgi:2-polyprenyl-3-methyl-5-hydroxy-6-metoxy-1,4-benzoquinol methylase
MSTSRYAQDIDLANLNDSHTLAVLSVPPDSQVLDVGAADGSVASALVERGCTVHAVEVDPASAREAQEHCQRVVVGDVEELDVGATFDGAGFDAILLLDVLEHLRDPLAVLRKVTGVLADRGRVIVSVPNVAHAAVKLALLGGRFQYTELGLLDRTHLRFFDKPALDQLLADAGLVVEEELRVTRGVTETEIPIDLDAFAPEVVAEATRAPESETYQFVVVAAPGHDGEGPPTSLAGALQGRVEELGQAVERAEARVRALEEQLSARDAELAEHGAWREERLELEQAVRRHDAELVASRREVAMLHQDLALKERSLMKLRATVAETDVREAALRAEIADREAALGQVLRSPSWRLTGPLRSLKRRVRRRLAGLRS